MESLLYLEFQNQLRDFNMGFSIKLQKILTYLANTSIWSRHLRHDVF